MQARCGEFTTITGGTLAQLRGHDLVEVEFMRGDEPILAPLWSAPIATDTQVWVRVDGGPRSIDLDEVESVKVVTAWALASS